MFTNFKEKVLTFFNKIKSYLYSCLERSFNSCNENDKAGL